LRLPLLIVFKVSKIQDILYFSCNCHVHLLQNMEIPCAGSEKDIIILSCVRSGGGGIGFLSDYRRLNVSITRARHSLWIVGNMNVLCQDKIWKNIADDAYKQNLLWAQHLYDENHGLRKPKPIARAKRKAASGPQSQSRGLPVRPERHVSRGNRRPPVPPSTGLRQPHGRMVNNWQTGPAGRGGPEYPDPITSRNPPPCVPRGRAVNKWQTGLAGGGGRGRPGQSPSQRRGRH